MRVPRGRTIRRLLAVLVLLGGVGGPWVAGSVLTRSTTSDVPDAVAPAQDVRLRSADGLSLAGTYWPGDRSGNRSGAGAAAPGLLLLHGNNSSRAVMAGNAAWFARQGYAVLTIDLRGHGESAAAEHSFGLLESRDAWAGYRWLQQRQNGAPVGIVGVSLGGAATLIGDEGPIPAPAIVLQAVYPELRRATAHRLRSVLGPVLATALEPTLSYQSYPRLGVAPGRLSPVTAIAGAHSSFLVIGGLDDVYTPPADTEAMVAAAPKGTQVWWVPDLDHAALSGLESDAYRQQVEQFFDARLRGVTG